MVQSEPEPCLAIIWVSGCTISTSSISCPTHSLSSSLMAASGALQPGADDAAYGRICLLTDLLGNKAQPPVWVDAAIRTSPMKWYPLVGLTAD